MSAVRPVYPKQQTFSGPVGTSHLCHKRLSAGVAHPCRRRDASVSRWPTSCSRPIG